MTIRATSQSILRALGALVLLLGTALVGLAVPNPAAAVGGGIISVDKSNTIGENGEVLPGQEFTWKITVKCTSITKDCLDFQLKDIVPPELEITSVPGDTPNRVVTQQGNEVTIDFLYDLDFGAVGIGAGDTYNVQIGVRLPHNSPALDGTTIINTANATATGSTPAGDTSTVVVKVPVEVRPVGTKAWSDGSAIAGTDEASTITLGLRNNSSTSAEVESLSVRDDAPATFEHFNFTGAEVTAFPAGADRAQLRVKVDGNWIDAQIINAPAPGTFNLPPGVMADQVVGVETVFTNSVGTPLPYDATGGTVELGMVLRDTLRSTDATIEPTQKITVNNCAVPSAVEATKGEVKGANACRSYDIIPDIMMLEGTKNFFADTDGSWGKDSGEHAVLGQNSAVTAEVGVKNNSPFPLSEITITEPAAGAASEFEKFDVKKIRLRFPADATTATVTVSYDDGSTQTLTRQGNDVIDLMPGLKATKIEVTYRGVDAGGAPAIKIGTAAYLDLHGNLNNLVTVDDLPDGTSPHVANCAAFQGSDGRVNAGGSSSGVACKDLVIEMPTSSSEGVKQVGQTSVPMGQPIPFTLKVSNNGNLPLVNPTIIDPPVDANGAPTTPNAFTHLQITSASISKSANTPGVTIELHDPTAAAGAGAWVPYAAGDAPLLERAIGVRAKMNGSLAPTKQFTLKLVTERRASATDDDLAVLNCFSTTADGDYTAGNPTCSPELTLDPANASASLNKSISPGTLPEYVPGLARQKADVTLTARNVGNLSTKFLTLTDTDVDFFDNVDLTAIKSVKLPAGADRVIVEVQQGSASWITGQPQEANQVSLPAGAVAADVTGIRVRFVSTDTSTNDGYVITPCTTNSCDGQFVFTVSPRVEKRNAPGTPVDKQLENTVSGEFQTQIDNTPRPIPDASADLDLVAGDPELSVDKRQNAVLEPGEVTSFELEITNPGTANITGLVVRDLLPVGMQLDEKFVGDGGFPYEMLPAPATVVPAGTPAVPTPVYSETQGNGRVESMDWDFSKDANGDHWVLAPGAKITLRIWVTLEPGVTAGQIVTNTMGAQASNPDFACRPAGQGQQDGSMGDGLWCTDTAQLTVKEGSAFIARKWDHGNDTLGWWNTRSQTQVPAGDVSCPVLRKDGVTYTRYPCAVLVNPGDQHDYLLRVINAGTTDATEIRIVDELPHMGDTNKDGTEDRGTTWDNRPTLATAPTATNNANLVTDYSDNLPICFSDLDMNVGAPTCAPGDWDAAFSPDVTAFKLTMVPASGVFAPGEKVDVEFKMDTPLDVAQSGNPTLAWNTIAHAERAVTAQGTDVLLPITEPIKVGVGLAYGQLDLAKLIGDNGGLDLDAESFDFRARCSIEPIGRSKQIVLNETYSVSANTPASVSGIPAGATCEVWEVDARGGVTDHDKNNPLVVSIAPNFDGTTVTTAQITNDYPETLVNLTKVVSGDAKPYAPDRFELELSCRDLTGAPLAGFDPKTVVLKPGQMTYQASVPSGSTCSAIETETGSATDVEYSPAAASGVPGSGEVVTVPDAPQDITVTNVFRAGSLLVRKEVAGAGAPELAQGPFGFNVTCAFNGVASVFTKDLTIAGDGTSGPFDSDAITGLPAGAVCTVTETDPGGADAAPSPLTVTIVADDTVAAGFVGQHANQFSAGTIALTKTLTGSAAGSDLATSAEFEIMLTCRMGGSTVYSAAQQIKGGQTIDPVLDGAGNPVKLPVGATCWGEETVTGGATEATVDHDSEASGVTVTVQSDPEIAQSIDITATNRFDTADLALHKVIRGSASNYVADREFELAVTCVLEQGTGAPTPVLTDAPYKIKAGETVTIEDLPVGAACWAVETDTGGASQSAVDHDSMADAIVLSEASTVQITATNTFPGANLVISKRVVNGPAGPYTFEVTCRTEDGKVALSDKDSRFKLKAGEKRVLHVPVGATCTVREIDAPKNAEVSYVDSDRKQDGVVKVTARSTVQVVNDFTNGVLDDSEENGNNNAGLGDTGGPEQLWLPLGVVLLFAGSAMLVISRRRRV